VTRATNHKINKLIDAGDDSNHGEEAGLTPIMEKKLRGLKSQRRNSRFVEL
jgi:hypothetical protein